ncbi:hypothetical protein SteCoe_30900 [Stentor coeruleus]|uniref:Cyclin-like domain-containing protein n=1 Tax=Stentor coeruleus TaxID=5963 RepID=A0A1R2B2L9_9CILI|nr:hypothetical protein SteCoe_30900 [Stentor coeruleus]
MKGSLSQLMFLDQVMNFLKAKEKVSLIQNALNKHEINESLRAKMVDWMIEVITKFELSIKTFFLSVKIMDKYLQLSCTQHMNNDILLIGITCMFIATKLEDVVSCRLKTFVRAIGHGKIKAQDIINMEKIILITLGFEIDMPVCVDFLTLICGIYGVPDYIRKATENLLIIFQLFSNLQNHPSLETGCALYLASKFLNFELNQEIILFLSSSTDFSNRVHFMKEQLYLHNEGIKKYKNAFLYTNFELVTSNSCLYFKYLSDEEIIINAQ